ncbi:hypothetical protein GCM10025868_12760 [Angustibacter aerolatus]|uniref:Uncharacterized protein n=1 Tax=Angustibacter aerolatus TaxID=1162965 RepID=A0ABQ6JEL0_9ACTN|nr:hypothetical protein GCM10025868_12760 [Angustibacter aerolatus]
MWTSRSLGMHAKPVVVLDPWDDLAGLRSLVAGLAEQGFVRPGVGDHLVWTTDVDAALDAVERGLHLGGAVGAP